MKRAYLPIYLNYTVNGLNEYTGISTNTGGAFGYDLNGNLTFDGASSYTYDIENRLIQSFGPKSTMLLHELPGRLVACNHPRDGHVTVITLREIELEALTNIIKCWLCEYS